jgi:hypothetical protein
MTIRIYHLKSCDYSSHSGVINILWVKTGHQEKEPFSGHFSSHHTGVDLKRDQCNSRIQNPTRQVLVEINYKSCKDLFRRQSSRNRVVHRLGQYIFSFMIWYRNCWPQRTSQTTAACAASHEENACRRQPAFAFSNAGIYFHSNGPPSMTGSI